MSIVLFVIAFAATAADAFAQDYWAQIPQCQVRSLFWETDATGVLDTADCKPYVPSRGLLRAEYWDFALNAGDYVVLTIQRGTMLEPFVSIYDPRFVRVAADDEKLPGAARALFRAPTSGVYRAVVSSAFPEQLPDLGTYTIRLDPMTTPFVQEFSSHVIGSQVSLSWVPGLTPTPILGYTIFVGSRPGASDVGQFDVGAATEVTASAGPGVYYVRVRARNSYGLGEASIERTITVGPELSAPQSLRVAVQGRRVTLTWFAPLTGGATYYELLVGSAPLQSDIGTLLVANVTTISVDEVPTGIYYVRVRAGNARGPGAESNEVVVLVF